MTYSNNDQNNFKKYQLIKGFHGLPYINKIELTTYERKILQNYIYEECDLPFEKELNFDSEIVKFIIDFARYYNYKS